MIQVAGVVWFVTVVVANSHYYQALNPNSFEFNYNPNVPSSGRNEAIDDYVEKKYVNSGQSVTLICDLPNNMPDGRVLFIKYDNKVLSSANGVNIRGDNDDERFEIGQQYAWEWSLKINSINEDDSGVYLCKVGNTIIKRFEIIVRVPPRIRDSTVGSNGSTSDLSSHVYRQIVREGSRVEFACFANGTPRPNITWYVMRGGENVAVTPQLLSHSGTYLRIENVTRFTPTRYQCRASNGIPPSDTRNLTLSVEFAPEIEIQSRYDTSRNIMNLNCTIVANPLTNRNFWRKDGKFLLDTYKYEIENVRINEYTLISKLLIKYYDETDQGLYECTAENDLRVSKLVFNLREENSISQKAVGSLNEIETSSINKQKTKKPEKYHNRSKPSQLNPRWNFNKIQSQSNDEQSSSSINNVVTYDSKTNVQSSRKHQRNQRNNSTTTTTKGTAATAVANQITTDQMKTYKSPYIILIDDDDVGEQSKTSGSQLSIIQNRSPRLAIMSLILLILTTTMTTTLTFRYV